MARRSQSAFQTIKTEGALLPADLLSRIADGDKDLDGLTPESYHLDKSEKINEVTNRAWTACQDAWQRFRKGQAELPASDKGTTLTRDRWLLKIFEVLGYGRLQTWKSFEIEGKTYAISHGWGSVPIHLISYRHADIDKAGEFRSSPHSLVQEFLNRSDDYLWGFLSNGLQLRILRDNVSFTRAAYVEFDLESMMDGDVYSDFVLLWMLCHQSRVEADQPEQCWLEKWHQAARQQGTRALDTLRKSVEKAIEVLGQGFLVHRSNGDLRRKLADGALTTQVYYQQLLRLVYRFIFLFVAEDRDLLLPASTDEAARERYAKHYALSRVRRIAERRRGTRHGDLWHGVRLVLSKLYKGELRLGLPALGSFLFSDKATPNLDACELQNDHLLVAIRNLTFTAEGRVLRQVDYKNLGSEELGSVYESLLELHPDVNADSAKFELSTVTGSERKTTGSYYTPTSLINCLLDSALDPVVDDRLKGNRGADAEKALLDLKICDPACGSGHFLIAAANRVAKRLAAIRTGDEEPSPADQRAAFRDVVSHCIYGVDINPMAVELCKVALWLESIDPGRPLSFLDHRILCGNSLIGATPRLLAEGIPDDAFKPIEGDDEAVCGEFKRRNKDERKGQLQLDFGAMPQVRLGNLIQTFADLSSMDDDSLEDLEAKKRRYAEFVGSTGYQSARLSADAWCAAFVWKKVKSAVDCITESWFRRIEANPHSAPAWMKEEITQLNNEYQFFHWHLAFPDAFWVPGNHESPDNEHTGWSSGFDLVLGNPPWDNTELQEKQFFAQRDPDIAGAPTAAVRKVKIQALSVGAPELFAEYRSALRFTDALSQFPRASGLYPLCTRGRLNTFSLFTELSRNLIASVGRLGVVIPTGIATDDNLKEFFDDLLQTRTLVQLIGFENEEFLFPGIANVVRFCILVVSGFPQSQSPEFAFYLRRTAQLNQRERFFSLSGADIGRLSPNTRTCPVFRTKKDAELTTCLYSRAPVFVLEQPPHNPWGVELRKGLFNTASDSSLFRKEPEVGCVPLYEGKYFWHFDHRFASYDLVGKAKGKGGRGLPNQIEQNYRDWDYSISPRYWVQNEACATRIPPSWGHDWLIAFRDIATSKLERTCVAAVIPRVGVSDTAGLIFPLQAPKVAHVACLLANLNSLVFDYVVRQKIGGTHLTSFALRQIPTLTPNSYTEQDIEYIAPRVVELVFTARDVASFARDVGYAGDPYTWDVNRRRIIRAELDAYFAQLYGLSRDDVRYILDPTDLFGANYPGETFRVLKEKEMSSFGRFVTLELVLEKWDALHGG